MARTDNTMPRRVQEADGKHLMVDAGGSFQRIGRERLRPYWRAERRRVRTLLHGGSEPAPTLPRHGEKWAYW